MMYRSKWALLIISVFITFGCGVTPDRSEEMQSPRFEEGIPTIFGSRDNISENSIGVSSSKEIAKQRLWIPNGPVLALEILGNTLFVGGKFSKFGPYTGSGVILDAVKGKQAGHWPYLKGSITASVPGPEGGFYVAGEFIDERTGKVPYLVKIKADGKIDSNWTGQALGKVDKLFLFEGRLYVASWQGVYALDASSGKHTGWQVATVLPSSIAVAKGVVYVGRKSASTSESTLIAFEASDSLKSVPVPVCSVASVRS